MSAAYQQCISAANVRFEQLVIRVSTTEHNVSYDAIGCGPWHPIEHTTQLQAAMEANNVQLGFQHHMLQYSETPSGDTFPPPFIALALTCCCHDVCTGPYECCIATEARPKRQRPGKSL